MFNKMHDAFPSCADNDAAFMLTVAMVHSVYIGMLLRQKYKEELHSHMKDRWSQFETQYLYGHTIDRKNRPEKYKIKPCDDVWIVEVRVAKDVLSIKRNLCFTICI